MKLKAIRAHYVGGKRVDAGGSYEADDTLGRQLIAAGKSVAVADKAARAAKPGPMTTKTAGALVPGAEPEKEQTHVLPSQ